MEIEPGTGPSLVFTTEGAQADGKDRMLPHHPTAYKTEGLRKRFDSFCPRVCRQCKQPALGKRGNAIRILKPRLGNGMAKFPQCSRHDPGLGRHYLSAHCQIAAIHHQIGTGDELGGIADQESYGMRNVLGLP